MVAVDQDSFMSERKLATTAGPRIAVVPETFNTQAAPSTFGVPRFYVLQRGCANRLHTLARLATGWPKSELCVSGSGRDLGWLGWASAEHGMTGWVKRGVPLAGRSLGCFAGTRQVPDTSTHHPSHSQRAKKKRGISSEESARCWRI